MLKSRYFFLVMIFSLLLQHQLFAGFDSSECNRFNIKIDEIIEKDPIPALAVAIVGPDGLLCKKFIGTTKEGGKKISAETIFPIASITKGFLGSLLSIMSENKQFSWDQVVHEQVKEFKLKNDDYTNKLTFHHIASMQTGLEEFAAKEFIENASNRSDIIKSFAFIDSIDPPGNKKFSYQYAVLAVFEEIIKKRTGLEWEKLLQKKILEPLKLINTSTDLSALTGKENVVELFDLQQNKVEWENYKVTSAAGLYSTLNDLSRWLQLHINQGSINNKQIVSKSEISQMRNSYTVIEHDENFTLPKEQVKNLSYGRFWKNYQYQSGTMNHKVIEHSGITLGSVAIINFMPAKQIGIIVLANKISKAPDLIREKFLQVMTGQ